MQDVTQSNKNQKQNKGFTVHVGDTYVGYLVIGEKNVKPEDVAALQEPAAMAVVLKNAELRPFKPAEAADMSNVMQLIKSGDITADDDDELPSMATS